VNVVPPQAIAGGVTTAAGGELTAAGAVLFEAVPELAEEPRVEAATLFPARSTAVKLEKPWATMTWATLKPSAEKGVVTEVFELAFSMSWPPTAGSMRGTTPRRAAVVGRVGSEQMDGMLTTKGLKFCSAATRPRAAAIALSLVPSSAMIWSAWVSLPHGLAAARRNWMEPPARVAAWPDCPRSDSAEMAAIAPFPCS